MARTVSLITTVFNEARTISALLDSIIAQQRRPNEIIIVDAGSTDRTQEIISDYLARGLPARLIVAPEASRAHGRNLAIAEATGEIIASIDAGCIAEPEWLARLVEPFESEAPPEVVSGYYLAGGVTPFEQAVAAATVPKAEEVNPQTFLPSSRSVAYLRSAWRQAGGYPEHLEYAEDTLFDLNLRRMRCRFRFQPSARVRWRMVSSLSAVYRQFRNYARSDGELGHWLGHYRKAFLLPPLLFIALLLTLLEGWFALLFPAFGLLYWLRYYRRARRRGAEKRVAVRAPLVNLVVDAAHLVGFAQGWRRRRPLPPPLPTGRPLSIAQITYTYQPIAGGADVYVQQLADLITAAGHRHTVYQRRTETREAGVRFVPNLLRGRPLEFWMQTLGLFRLWRELMAHDVVICHYPPYLLAVYLMSKLTRGPVRVALSHGVFWDDRPGSLASRLKGWIARTAFTRAHLFIANDTEFLRQMGIKLPPRHRRHEEIGPGVWFIPNGVDTYQFRATTPLPDLRAMNAVLVPRNLYRNRGIHLAVQAFAVFHGQHRDTTLVIVGGGGQPAYVEEVRLDVERRGLTKSVIFAGPREHAEFPAIYSSARLTLIPSLCGEGTSLSALESMACGTATICTWVAGLKDLPGPHAAPDPESLAEVMRQVYLKRLATGDEQRRIVSVEYSLALWRRSWRLALGTAGVPIAAGKQEELPLEG